jgi:hypothetical protein
MYVRVTRLKEKAPKTPTVHLQTRTFVHLALTLTRERRQRQRTLSRPMGSRANFNCRLFNACVHVEETRA